MINYLQEREQFERAAVLSGEYRLIHNRKRRRTLQKRGERIWWSTQFNCYVWDFLGLPF